MKYFLLIAGDHYYPSAGTGDWRGCYETQEEAQRQVIEVKYTRTITKGKHKGEEEYAYSSYTISGAKYDWYDIVDLRDFINTQ